MEINRRIKEIRTQKKMSQQEFSDYLGISRSYINTVERGKQPSYNFVMALIESAGVNESWLLKGKGTMYQCTTGEEPKSNHEDIEKLFSCLREYWESASNKEKVWMEVQLKKIFPECDK